MPEDIMKVYRFVSLVYVWRVMIDQGLMTWRAWSTVKCLIQIILCFESLLRISIRSRNLVWVLMKKLRTILFMLLILLLAPRSALSRSLPAHLHLDPVKMQQMRALFFAEGEEAEVIAPPGTYGRWQSRPLVPSPAMTSSGVYGSPLLKTPQKASPGEDADGRPAWPQRSSPWKGDLKGALAGLDVDWKRFMGLVMWYQLSPDTDLPYLIETFEGLLEKQRKYVEERVSVYDSCLEAQGYDTAYYLMLLHAKESTVNINVRRMLSASASTFERLDQKLAWHQQGILHAIRTRFVCEDR